MNNNNIIFLTPFLDQKIWGGTRLKEFNYELNSDKIGEALIISAIPNKSSRILNDNITEKTLLEFYNNHQDFFGNYNKQYPLLTKIIDANDDLSVQVHPDDAYSLSKHNQPGKTECWYILDAKENSKIVYGLNCLSIAEIRQALYNDDIEKYLHYKDVKSGDIIYVPAGTVHAISSGMLIYELQQSSDITYRLYDYNRLENNKPRELMKEDALNVIKLDPPLNVTNNDYLIDCEYFKLLKMEINNETKSLDIAEALWLEVTVINGDGVIDGIEIKKGSVFLIRHQHRVMITGNLSILIGYITK